MRTLKNTKPPTSGSLAKSNGFFANKNGEYHQQKRLITTNQSGPCVASLIPAPCVNRHHGSWLSMCISAFLSVSPQKSSVEIAFTGLSVSSSSGIRCSSSWLIDVSMFAVGAFRCVTTKKKRCCLSCLLLFQHKIEDGSKPWHPPHTQTVVVMNLLLPPINGSDEASYVDAHRNWKVAKGHVVSQHNSPAGLPR